MTYPIVTAMQGLPKVKAVRGISDFGYSSVYVIFEDGRTCIGRGRAFRSILPEYSSKLPAGVKTELGPDATALGWVFQYALTDDTGKLSLSQLRTTQDLLPPLSSALGSWGRGSGFDRRLCSSTAGHRRRRHACKLCAFRSPV